VDDAQKTVQAQARKAVQDQLGRVGDDGRVAISRDCLKAVPKESYAQVFAPLLQDKPEDAAALAGGAVAAAPAGRRSEAAKAALAALTAEERQEVGRAVFGPPSDRTRDRLWTVVIGALVAVMLAAVLVLAVNSFLAKVAGQEMRVSPEVMLSLFTSVFGFLAGLFVPSPGGRPNPPAGGQ
jgi:uncharacterized membrane protein YbhN (UPF0104 family)